MEKARKLLDADNTLHFNAKVSPALRLRLWEVAQAIKDDFIGDCRPGESFGTASINAIYGYHVSGFIPSQLGGFEISELYRYDQDPSYHFTSAQTDAMNKATDYMHESFARDYREQLEAYFKANNTEFDPKAIDYSIIEAAGLDNTFSDYENDWFEPALLRLEMWVDDAEHKQRIGIADNAEPQQVFIRLGLNYRDAPYYRTKSDDTLFEFNMTIADFFNTPPEAIIKMLEEKMKGVE